MSLMTSRHFVFNGKSSEDFDIVIGFFGEDNGINTNGNSQSIQSDEPNINTRKINIYGTVNDEMVKFNFAILKCDGEPFTQYESVQINEWLLGPKTPKMFKFINDSEHDYDLYDLHYYAICTSVTDKVYSGLNGKELTFETNSSYAYMDEIERKIDVVGNGDITITNSIQMDNFIYHPTIYITSNEKIEIKNIETEQTIFYDLTSFSGETLKIDNEKMRLMVNDKIIPMTKIGWTEDDIQWLGLIPGLNHIQITGTCELVVKCEYPRKAGVM